MSGTDKYSKLKWVPYELSNGYFQWLCELVAADDEDRPYIYLLRELYETEFSDETAALIPNDDNRIEDGLALREDFSNETGIHNRIILTGPCSLLEMMIALAYRMEDAFGKYDYIHWFWEMIFNLELMDYDDTNENWRKERVSFLDEAIETLLKRKYNRDGDGSLFPMNHAKRDMRKTEIWYQMSNYLVERYME